MDSSFFKPASGFVSFYGRVLRRHGFRICFGIPAAFETGLAVISFIIALVSSPDTASETAQYTRDQFVSHQSYALYSLSVVTVYCLLVAAHREHIRVINDTANDATSTRPEYHLQFVENTDEEDLGTGEIIFRVGVIHDRPDTCHTVVVEVVEVSAIGEADTKKTRNRCKQMRGLLLRDIHYKNDCVDLHSGPNPHWFDFVNKVVESETIGLCHKVNKAKLKRLPDGEYRIKLAAKGQNTHSDIATFRVWTDAMGMLKCKRIVEPNGEWFRNRSRLGQQ